MFLTTREQVALHLYAAFMSSTLTLSCSTPEEWAFEMADRFLEQAKKEQKKREASFSYPEGNKKIINNKTKCSVKHTKKEVCEGCFSER